MHFSPAFQLMRHLPRCCSGGTVQARHQGELKDAPGIQVGFQFRVDPAVRKETLSLLLPSQAPPLPSSRVSPSTNLSIPKEGT